MTGDQLAVERAAWAVDIKHMFDHFGFTYGEHFNAYQIILMVKHPEAPEWKAKVTICSAHGKRNRLEINDKVIGHSCKPAARRKLLTVLNGLKANHIREIVDAKAKEATAAQWQARQEQELAGLPEFNGVNVEIIRRGPNEGRYAVTLQPGNPLERLTLDETKAFHTFLRSCCPISRKRSTR